MQTDAPKKRFHGLDGVRAVAMLLGITMHISLSFVRQPLDWAIHDTSTSVLADLVAQALHPFRLSVFFLAAGFFAHMLYHRRGLSGFVRHRAVRILLPLVVGWIVVGPPLLAAWVYGYIKTQAALGIPLREMADTYSRPSQPFFAFPRFPLMHLWFLYYLLILYAGALTGRGILLRLFRGRLDIRRKADAALRKILGSHWRVPLLAIPTLACLLGMRDWDIHVPDRNLAPDLPVYFLYGSVLCFGWLLHRQPELLREFRRHYLPYFAVGCGVFVLMVFGLSGFESKPTHPWYPAVRFVYLCLYALYMWFMMFSMIGFFEEFFDRPNAKLRYIADSSYWLYLVHLPLVIFLQVLIAYWDLWWWVKFLLIHLVSIPLLLLSYHVLVRRTWIGAWLNGRRYKKGGAHPLPA